MKSNKIKVNTSKTQFVFGIEIIPNAHYIISKTAQIAPAKKRKAYQERASGKSKEGWSD